MGLQSALNIGRQSILANQAALQTIAHNISNAGVEGYSRQEVVLANNPPTAGFLGTGVHIETVRQLVDRFLNAQITRFKADEGSLNAQAEGILLAEAFLSESGTEGGINGAINNFFLAAEDLATSPESAAERNALINAAETLVDKFNRLGGAIEDLQVEADRDITRAITEVNQFVERIAFLNDKIRVSETAGDTANDLRDERQRILEQLSERIDVSSVEEDDGAFLLFVGRSSPIVQKGVFNKIVGIQDSDNVVPTAPPVALQRVFFEDNSGVQTDITARISGGEIGGLLKFRDTTMKDLIEDVNNIAATIVNEVNIIHRQGFGLDESTNIDFFQPLNLTIDAASTNSKDTLTNNRNVQAILSNSRIFDPTALTMADYEVEFTSATTFTITAADTNQKLDATKVSINAGPFGTDSTVTEFNYSGGKVTAEFEGLRVSIQNFGGSPEKDDKFTVSVKKGAARDIRLNGLVVADVNKVAAAGTPGLPGDNTNALALADLRAKTVAGRDSATINEFMNGIISNFGTLGGDIVEQQGITTQVKDALNANREATSGVSIDEELTFILQFQQNFGASARMIATITDLLQQIIDIL
ncbi:flagellar hook-associated protein FlgK [Nitrospinota bacterium]